MCCFRLHGTCSLPLYHIYVADKSTYRWQVVSVVVSGSEAYSSLASKSHGRGWGKLQEDGPTATSIQVAPPEIFIHAGSSHGGKVFTGVCVSVYFSERYSPEPLQLRSPNLTQKCSTMSPGKPIYFGVKRSKVKVMRHKKQCRRGSLHSMNTGFIQFWQFSRRILHSGAFWIRKHALQR